MSDPARAAAPASEDDEAVHAAVDSAVAAAVNAGYGKPSAADVAILRTIVLEQLRLVGYAVRAAGSPPPTPAPTRSEVRNAILANYSTDPPGIIDRAADAVMALLPAEPAPPLWTQETRATDADPTKSYIAPPLLDCPPGTAVEVREVKP